MAPSYDLLLVLFSLLIAVLASYTALDLSGRIVSARGRAAHLWLAGGAMAMGLGIWAMHFVGMQAYQLPIRLGYDPVVTLLSLVIAVLASAFALKLVSLEHLPWRRLCLGALGMGAAVSSMHYMGMAALRMRPGIDYDPLLFALSIVIAVAASGAALWIAFRLRRQMPRVRQLRMGAALVMGSAIAAMHYTGMAAASIAPGSVCGAARTGLDSGMLTLPIVVITLCVLAVALITSVLDMRLEMRTGLLVQALTEANEELSFLAMHDKLTRLPNRALLDDRFLRIVQASSRGGKRFAVLFIDLDGFKGINDSYGHQAGDTLLLEIARRLGLPEHGIDTVARVGGDEFVVLVEVDTPDAAGVLAQCLLTAICEPVQAGGQALHVSASIGIAVYPDDGDSQHALLTNADAAMYHAKAAGRNACYFFESSMNFQAGARQVLIQDMRAALAASQFVLHYQPKYRAPDGPLLGAEALLRWNHPVHGMISPDGFIGLAEKSGLIVAIGEWVLNEACRQLAVWHAAGHPEWTIAVNLSALQFCQENLLHTVAKVLERHAIPPHCLTLEITESTAMHDVDESLRILGSLDALGVRIAIDDFGTGYSSLLHLKRIPASELKIDRGFVRDLAHDTEDAAIVSAIVALGRTLSLNVVAEGVETHAQRKFLTEAGCDALQGYLLGEPIPASAFPGRERVLEEAAA
ncbi:putative bifunctional diguanylate cyclase/phosphodiesterase [Cupriavidus numazuensis]|uniref:Signaling protein n=1 Tax=Cupriavidus numazuensis TaxID=221992 RepID=A0ABM8TAL4_9BURK|nr:bifunctional diguanylate cyclase/phosphodiesterase [Cupriavidus numazuensis]CAG2131820.1 putative signaling protein [Cupriavidus numazuensis]